MNVYMRTRTDSVICIRNWRIFHEDRLSAFPEDRLGVSVVIVVVVVTVVVVVIVVVIVVVVVVVIVFMAPVLCMLVRVPYCIVLSMYVMCVMCIHAYICMY